MSCDAPQETERPWNVLLLVDTLRADHLELCGHFDLLGDPEEQQDLAAA